MRKLLTGLILILVLAGSAGWIFQKQIGERLFARAVEQAFARDLIGNLPDGLHVVLCGSGSPLSDPSRAGPCTAVIAGERIFIVDIGGGAVRNLGQMGLPMANVEALLLTHFHSDHIDGMGELLLQRWAGGGHDSPLPVYGAEGVEAIVDGLNGAYAADVQYRIAHHGAATMPPSGAGGIAQPFALPEGQEQAVVYNREGLKITAFRVNHEPVEPAFGYRFDYKGRSVVLSGDTAKDPRIAGICTGCDLLVHEVLNAEMVGKMQAAAKQAGNARVAKIMADIPSYHATPVEVAEIAGEAETRMLVLSHIVPAVPLTYLESYYLKGTAEAFDGEIVLGRDGMLFSLPANKNSIDQDQLL
ncbi:ribonuclease Z [Parasphingorhabdus marina DSM 22363]|uniref:Ribonuclease Z n=1 Tax=Parasphingorhabdus marina DSM 22363 TaxID=1123272 RepID=A0A1N6CRP8_9SPHN|nr:MBL fold metallo-hydrolase [Parasphingorhabdus marina]SIN61157.1 ribonuclease Z [Parasphingorhabdus marina DSM 22363]